MLMIHRKKDHSLLEIIADSRKMLVGINILWIIKRMKKMKQNQILRKYRKI